MSWRIHYLPEIEKDMRVLDKAVREEVIKTIRRVSTNPDYPDGYGKPLLYLALLFLSVEFLNVLCCPGNRVLAVEFFRQSFYCAKFLHCLRGVDALFVS